MKKGTTAYRRATVAMLAVGLAIFNTLYATQALLPTLVTNMGITPTEAAWTISAATGALALCVVPASILSERFGRGRVLIISALAATALGLLLPLAQDASQLIALRAVQGALVAGTPAVAMAWLSEEIHADDLPGTMGIYIAGNTIGGLTGRLIPAGLLEFTTWRWALFGSGLVALLFAITMALLLPRQRNFTPKQISLLGELRAMVGHLRNPLLVTMFLTAFLGMGTFVSLYNFFGFRMVNFFGLAPSLVGLVFVMYLSGTVSSAQAGNLIKRFGRPAVITASAALMLLGALACISNHLWVSIGGLFVFTASFFAMHSTASGWVGATATTNRAEASSMYTFSYYAGSSLVGAATGVVFERVSWAGFVGTLAGILIVLLLVLVLVSVRAQRS
ncbi:MFS transporter [Corynebacterium cystitidis]|uniref:MFS transporter, YNFM family, putative membrane transport protein n=1 Tax=Corynebacterium cystitidis DSM 20524 TaxID=1121357 RepID=A0A1H9TER2_9CORY|nr:MFS transporter [Corynebacterium cystitidis]WJY83587.1 Inner membrane transport protein YnfM [Corynebacterium cystitidis DSM 20524]SER95598.1 MFS transporter, YNFM family, putative membrane transport protein [Corynebacterium cystitidis DSM 20524]SNV91885.1 major facilitator superfamily permease [Corynebacterium cystitidis]